MRSQSRDGSASICAELKPLCLERQAPVGGEPRLAEELGKLIEGEIRGLNAGAESVSFWTAAIHRRFAFGLMDLPARV